LSKGDKSHFHRLTSDEIWYYHAGGPTDVYIIDQNGQLHHQILGADLEKGEQFQVILQAGVWFAASPIDEFSLFGCMVAPGFDFQDFEIANKQDLISQFPEHKLIIENYCL
jgi:predicted cupin superfamily sugar epimerase